MSEALEKALRGGSKDNETIYQLMSTQRKTFDTWTSWFMKHFQPNFDPFDQIIEFSPVPTRKSERKIEEIVTDRYFNFPNTFTRLTRSLNILAMSYFAMFNIGNLVYWKSIPNFPCRFAHINRMYFKAWPLIFGLTYFVVLPKYYEYRKWQIKAIWETETNIPTEETIKFYNHAQKDYKFWVHDQHLLAKRKLNSVNSSRRINPWAKEDEMGGTGISQDRGSELGDFGSTDKKSSAIGARIGFDEELEEILDENENEFFE